MSFQLPIVHHYCTCTDQDYNPTQLGWMQKEYETLRLTGDSFSEAMEKMNIRRLCCREKFMNPPFLFLRIADIKIVDEAGLLSKKDKIKGFSRVYRYIPGEPILPKKVLPEIPK
jgi:hypothetical protein